ncbi:GNAT family N-acetyltransferase [Alteromonas sp. CI.11.F.A3]|uniref:GNAT family N-acetyltransferase n=1 Tax=Alteromonas sp. CI.11.F.A3 TaxID=3079555 RepID=UPI0029430E9A|nr:GNAT family N-acetyltransferase [Alteromonas sp. CI.11.F.A3]WOI36548.1 GNAT family N-acetyltransferase [Alteromonas sp. CI.11.F.A3]
MAPPELTQWLFNPIYSQARHTEHRRLLVLSGEYEWVNKNLTSILSDIPSTLIVKEVGAQNSLLRKHLLGNECDIGVVHAHQGFNPGNLMAIAGTIRWGGCLILCCPTLDSWHLHTRPSHLSHGFTASPSLYIKRLVARLKNDAHVAIWSSNNCHIPDWVAGDTVDSLNRLNPVTSESSINQVLSENAHATQPLDGEETRRPQFKSVEQQAAFDCLTNRWSQGNRKAVITAPRGRGKSALLGMFVASRLKKGEKIVITSAIRENTSTLFKHIRIGIGIGIDIESSNSEKKAQGSLAADCGTDSNGTTNFNSTTDANGSTDDESGIAGTVTKVAFAIEDFVSEAVSHQTSESEKSGSAQWLAPDNSTLINGDYDLLIIDEAASFPLPVLKLLIGAHDNYVISTTLQGYEGSGQGFMQRMLPAFNAEGALHLSLSTPLRWIQNDKLESLIHIICLFEGTESFNTFSGAPPEILRELRQELRQKLQQKAPSDKFSGDYRIGLVSALSEHELHCVMQLLATAHYQTTPDDFMRLCDSPDIVLFTQWVDSRLIAAAIINCEGGEPLADVREGIADGSRRPKGHLGAQRLTLLTANPSTASYRYWRINRIAVAPHLQGQGLGRGLVSFINEQASAQNIDALTSSYGASDKLNHFWQQCGFTLVDMGEKPNKASGETSALVVKSISERFGSQQEVLLCLFTHSQATDIVPMSKLPTITRNTLIKKLNQFVDATRPLNQVSLAINALAAEVSVSTQSAKHTERATKACTSETDEVTPELLLLLTNSPLPSNKLIKLLGVNGRKSLTESLRKKIGNMLASTTI